jgi:glycosyltransferase involved in cell wall biosynthesis
MPRERPRVLFVGGRFEQKGGFDLLAALEPRLGHEVEVDLVAAAELPPRPGVRVHRLGPDDPRLIELYQQADIFCLPTHADASAYVVLEAMACGAAVVTTSVGASRELLDDGRAGLLVTPRDREELRSNLETVLGDERLREDLGARARRHCEEHYDARVQGEKLVELLRPLARSR